MPYLNDLIRDSGLNRLTSDVNRLDLTSQEPTTYAEATATYSLATKLSPSVGAPQLMAPNGRKVVIAALSGGTISTAGTATHWAIVDTVNARLLATDTLTAPVVTILGYTFSLSAFDIGIPDAV